MENYICILDIETSIDQYILQIAYNIYNRKTFELILSIDRLINEHVNKVDYYRKISLNDIKRKGLDVRYVFLELKHYLSFCSHVVCHNIAFDMSRINKYFNKLNIEFNEPIKVCTMKLSSNWCNLKTKNGRKKPPKLFELYYCCFGCNPNMDKCHSADYDVEITVMCLKRLVELKIIDFENMI
jgi:DNA polymerase III alpha subunit (gram-positive type)